jgi:hypothetical protein
MLGLAHRIWASSLYPTHTYINHFAKLYDNLKIFQIWQPTAVRHGVYNLTAVAHGGWWLLGNLHGGWT